MKTFVIVWLGQVISLLGSGLTSFALGIWVYQGTGSTTQYALISLFAITPYVVVSPLAGAIVDRWNRRWTLITSDSCAGLSTLAIALLLASNHLEIWHIYLSTAIISVCNAFQSPAYTSATTLLVPKQFLGRASGMIQLGEAIARLISPALAGVFLVSIQLPGIILVDFTTFLFALTTLLSVRFPHVSSSSDKRQPGSLLRWTIDGWFYISAKPGLLGLLLYMTAGNFFIGIAIVLITPLVLSLAPPTILGTIMSVSGAGMLLASLAFSTWRGGIRYINTLLGFMFLGGLSIFVAGLRPSIPLVALASFLGFSGWPIVSAASQVIFQKKSPPELQGRIFACKQMFSASALPLAYGVAGALADRIFEPLMAPDGFLASSIGRIIGVGSGRGIALLFIVVGLLTMMTTILAYCYRPLRRVEDELPDAIPD
ncbi:MAG: MFS transporter [Cyanophyceae cyanobacterium]